MTVKKIVFEVHKIVGLLTGIVVFLVAITGCCWSFKQEIEGFYDDYKQVTPQKEAFLTPSKAKEIGLSVFPNQTVHGTIFSKPDQAIQVIFYDAEPEFYHTIFLNPYSGAILHVEDNLSGFFAFILKGHMRLWLPKEIGEQVVRVSIMLFLLLIISGFILWMPKKRKNLKQRLTFDWKESTRWKRKNFDLHTIVGFYIGVFAFILAFTGSIISYDWMKYVVYKTAGGAGQPSFVIPENNAFVSNDSIVPMDGLIVKLLKEMPDTKELELHYPHTPQESIFVEVTNSDGLFYDADYRFFDQNTLQELETSGTYGKYKDATVADKILRMNYDIHIGAIGGIAGKILAFIISLLIATLPISGVLLWYGRTYKNKKKDKRLNRSSN